MAQQLTDVPLGSAPEAGLEAVQGQEQYYDEADRLLRDLIDISKIKRFKNSTTAVLRADEYANSMGITYDEIVHLTHKRNRVIKRRHPKQLQEFAVKILMKWMLSQENFDFPYPTEYEKAELCRIASITTSQLNHWFTNARKRVWTPLRKARGLPIPTRTDLVRGRQQRERAHAHLLRALPQRAPAPLPAAPAPSSAPEPTCMPQPPTVVQLGGVKRGGGPAPVTLSKRPRRGEAFPPQHIPQHRHGMQAAPHPTRDFPLPGSGTFIPSAALEAAKGAYYHTMRMASHPGQGGPPPPRHPSFTGSSTTGGEVPGAVGPGEGGPGWRPPLMVNTASAPPMPHRPSGAEGPFATSPYATSPYAMGAGGSSAGHSSISHLMQSVRAGDAARGGLSARSIRGHTMSDLEHALGGEEHRGHTGGTPVWGVHPHAASTPGIHPDTPGGQLVQAAASAAQAQAHGMPPLQVGSEGPGLSLRAASWGAPGITPAVIGKLMTPFALGPHGGGPMDGFPGGATVSPAAAATSLHPSPQNATGRGAAAPGRVTLGPTSLAIPTGGAGGLGDMGDTPLPSRPIDTERLGGGEGRPPATAGMAAPGFAATAPAPVQLGSRVPPRLPGLVIPPPVGVTRTSSSNAAAATLVALGISPMSESEPKRTLTPMEEWIQQGHGVVVRGITPKAADAGTGSQGATPAPSQ